MATPTTKDRINISDLAYATLGAGDALVARARQLTEQSDELPEAVTARLTDAIDQLREAVEDAVENVGTSAQKRRDGAEKNFDELSNRGRLLLERLSADREVGEAKDDVDEARQGVLGAITAIRNGAATAFGMIKGAGTKAETASESIADAAQSAGKTIGKDPKAELKNMTKAELYGIATDRDIEGRSGMTKDQLVTALS